MTATIAPGHQVPLPTLDGYVTGIVSLDPFAIQCGECGLVEVMDRCRTVGAWLCLTGSLFCRRKGHEGVRRCRACVAEHNVVCGDVT